MSLSKTKVSLIYTIPTDNILELKLNSDEAVANTIKNGLQFKNNQQICPIKFLGKKQLSSVESTQFILDVSCREKIKTLNINYTLFLDKFEEHKNKTRISIGSRSQNFEFNQNKKQHQINLTELAREWFKLKLKKTANKDRKKTQ